MKFAIDFDDYYRLLALHRVLMEAKFCEVPNDPVVAGSPLVAELANKVVDALVQWPDVPGGNNWASWRKMDPTRREWQVAVRRAATMDEWSRLDPSTKREVAANLLSPFTIDGALIDQFVAEADAAYSRHG